MSESVRLWRKTRGAKTATADVPRCTPIRKRRVRRQFRNHRFLSSGACPHLYALYALVHIPVQVLRVKTRRITGRLPRKQKPGPKKQKGIDKGIKKVKTSFGLDDQVKSYLGIWPLPTKLPENQNLLFESVISISLDTDICES